MSLEYKALEGQRISAALGAIGALPAAALVLGHEVSAASPFFAAALVAVVAAYVFWMFTDGIYHLTVVAPFDEGELELVVKENTPQSFAVFFYGAGSLLLSLFGLGAMHSGVTTSISVFAGFILVLSAALLVLLHCFTGMRVRNRLWKVARGAVLRSRAEAGE